jgi:hypothetical protein
MAKPGGRSRVALLRRWRRQIETENINRRGITSHFDAT